MVFRQVFPLLAAPRAEPRAILATERVGGHRQNDGIANGRLKIDQIALHPKLLVLVANFDLDWLLTLVTLTATLLAGVNLVVIELGETFINLKADRFKTSSALTYGFGTHITGNQNTLCNCLKSKIDIDWRIGRDSLEWDSY